MHFVVFSFVHFIVCNDTPYFNIKKNKNVLEACTFEVSSVPLLFKFPFKANMNSYTHLIIVSARSCDPVSAEITDENLMADCDSFVAGSTCSLSCKQKYALDGNDWVTCEDDPSTTEIDFVWNFVNTSCIGRNL